MRCKVPVMSLFLSVMFMLTVAPSIGAQGRRELSDGGRPQDPVFKPNRGDEPRFFTIEQKYRQFQQLLGAPMEPEKVAPDGIGRYRWYQGGAIFWTPDIGAFEIHGDIVKKWGELKWEAGPLGYPLTDERSTPDGVGRFNLFQHGAIFWTPKTDAHAVYGDIFKRWTELSRERGPIGYPITDEEDDPSGGRRSFFQHGLIRWTPDHGSRFEVADGFTSNHSPINSFTQEIEASAYIKLTKQSVYEGFVPYVGSFPSLGSINGKLTMLEVPSGNLGLAIVKMGHSTAECNNRNAVISLWPGSCTTPRQMAEIFGSETPSLPAGIVACVIQPDNSVRDYVLLKVFYKYYR